MWSLITLVLSLFGWSEATAQAPPVSECVSTALAGGTGDAITIARLPCVPTTTLLVLSVTVTNTTTTPTISPTGGPTQVVLNYNGQPVTIGQLSAGSKVLLTNNGVNWFVLSPNAVLAAGSAAVSIATFGAKCDGVTNDAGAFAAAFASGARLVTRPIGSKCFVNSTITVPDNAAYAGTDFIPGYPQTSGILCGPAANPCIKTGAATNASPMFSNESIFAQTPAVGTVGLLVNGSGPIHDHDLWVQGFAQNYVVQATLAPAGIYFSGDHLYSCSASNAHFTVIGVPGVFLSQSILGCNGAADVNSNAYILIQGNWDNAIGTIHLNDVHMNQGNNRVTCGISLANFTGSTNVLWDLEGIASHIEVAQNGICSDATVKGINILSLNNTWYSGGWGGSNHFFALNPATAINTWTLIGNAFTAWADVTLAPTAQINDLRMVGNSFLVPLSITGAGNSVMDLSANTYFGITLAGSFGHARVAGNTQSSSVSNTAAGEIEIDLPGGGGVGFTSCNSTLKLAIGGSTTGIAYAFPPVCVWQLMGNLVTVQFHIGLSSKGTNTGAATIVGLPFVANPASPVGNSPLLNINMAGLSGGVSVSSGPGTSMANLYFQGATGLNTLTDVTLTNTSDMQGTISYTIQ